MLANVIQAYTDRFSGEIYLAGDEVELSRERFAELASAGFVAGSDLSAMTAKELKAYITEHGGKVGRATTKAALIKIAESL